MLHSRCVKRDIAALSTPSRDTGAYINLINRIRHDHYRSCQKNSIPPFMLCVGFANKRNLQNKPVPIGARSLTACGLTQRPSGEVGIRPREKRFCVMLETYGTFIVTACLLKSQIN